MQKAIASIVVTIAIVVGIWLQSTFGLVERVSGHGVASRGERKENNSMESQESGKNNLPTTSKQASTTIKSGQESSVAQSSVAGASGSQVASSNETAVTNQASKKTAEAPWLGQVQARTFEISLNREFSGKVQLSQVECSGNQCSVKGTVPQATAGAIRPQMYVANFLEALSKSDVAGEESGRTARLNSIRMTSTGAEFAVTVAAGGPPEQMACSDVLNAWRRAHPEDFTTGNMFLSTQKGEGK